MPLWSLTSPCTTQALQILPIENVIRYFCSGRCGWRICFPCQLFAQENNLSDVVISMSGASEKNHESFLSFRFALGRVNRYPILGLLLLYSRHNHGNSLVERFHHFLLLWFFRFREFSLAITNITSLRNPRPDVVVQVSSHVQDQMPDTVSVRKRIVPEQLLCQRIDPFVDMLRNIFVVARKVGRNCIWKIRHRDPFIRGLRNVFLKT